MIIEGEWWVHWGSFIILPLCVCLNIIKSFKNSIQFSWIGKLQSKNKEYDCTLAFPSKSNLERLQHMLWQEGAVTCGSPAWEHRNILSVSFEELRSNWIKRHVLHTNSWIISMKDFMFLLCFWPASPLLAPAALSLTSWRPILHSVS